MNQCFMSETNQSKSPFVWQLPTRGAVTLAADTSPRALWVHEGRAGQSHTLPAGSKWVVEASPVARVTLVQAAPLRVKPRAGASWAQAWRAVVHVGRAWA
jgi:hypothetical protein